MFLHGPPTALRIMPIATAHAGLAELDAVRLVVLELSKGGRAAPISTTAADRTNTIELERGSGLGQCKGPLQPHETSQFAPEEGIPPLYCRKRSLGETGMYWPPRNNTNRRSSLYSRLNREIRE